MLKYGLNCIIFIGISSLLQADELKKDSTNNLKKNLEKRQTKKKLSNERIYLKGAIDLEGEHDVIPEFRVYFNGMEATSSAEGFYSFPIETTDITSYSLVITKNIDLTMEQHNTVQETCSCTGKRSKQFELTYHADQETCWSWKKQKTTRETISMNENNIIVLVDPKFFSRLKSWDISLTGQNIMLPTIVLNNDIPKKIERASTKSLLYSLDSKTFHETVACRKKPLEKGKGFISLVD